MTEVMDVLEGKNPDPRGIFDTEFFIIESLRTLRKIHKEDVVDGIVTGGYMSEKTNTYFNNLYLYVLANDTIFSAEHAIAGISSTGIRYYHLPINQKYIPAIKETYKKHNDFLTASLDSERKQEYIDILQKWMDMAKADDEDEGFVHDAD